ncbi:DUF4245 domain-containing protein [Streptosporangium carneum]|uniref:DUF4245 domain-containing protein n=1 Tax=Streptosporangium carneum TaxID=47481 RepID=A0A9W6I676_9ACTN|nr:DUF4245 domain-containing protein [Streptosporangium carneum]GLK11689.1 hypothetical protein GCM10017600_50960 [Streptosporangium carneum]
MRRFTEGFYGYAFAMLVCLAGVGAFLLVAPQSRTEHIPSVNFSIDLANMRREAAYQVWSPEPVQPGWVPTSSRRTEAKTPDGKTAVTWKLGFATAKRLHAMLAQSDERPAAEFANRMANSSTVVGSVQINGVTWEKRFREDKNQRSLIRFLPDTTVVVTGSAPWEELSALAGSLKQQPRITS